MKRIYVCNDELFCEYSEVEESEKKAGAVERLILKNLGWYAYKLIYQAALSTDPMEEPGTDLYCPAFCRPVLSGELDDL